MFSDDFHGNTHFLALTRRPSARRLLHAFCAIVVAAALAMPGPSGQAFAQSKSAPTSLDKRDLLNPPARGNGFLVGGVSLVTLVGVPSIILGVVFTSLRKSAHELGKGIRVPDSKLVPEDIPDNDEIQAIRRDVDRRLARVTNYFIVSSVVGVVGGATMLLLGTRRRLRYRRWRRVQRRALRKSLGLHQVAPVFSRSERSTLTYGFAARF